MTCLRRLGLREMYRSDADDLVKDFYVPCLTASTHYDRAVGYFTGGGLALAAHGLDAFVEHDGYMRLVASPVLSQEDLEALQLGHGARESVVQRRLLDALRESDAAGTSPVRLAWLIAEGRLDVRLAVPTQGIGLYHEKVGVFTDSDGCSIAFSGSANETVGGLVSNFESIDVFFSWDATGHRVERKRENFERLWANRTEHLAVLGLPDAVRQKLIEIAQSSPRRTRNVVAVPGHVATAVPSDLALRGYQQQAIDSWQRAGHRGVLAMATGTGKTKTALACAAVLESTLREPLVIIIVTPFKHLVDQWANECTYFGLRPIRCYESSAQWRPEAWEAIDNLRAGARRTVCLVTTNATSELEAFDKVLSAIPSARTLLIVDEVHHIIPRSSQLLQHEFRFRLGLSATPSRWNDEEGTDELLSYFGGVVFEFGIGAAIAAGFLCPYRYEPVLVELKEDELDEYRRVVDRLEALNQTVPRPDRERFHELHRERSRVLNTAVGKIGALRAQMSRQRPKHTLVYCVSRDQLGAVAEMIRAIGENPRAFTAEEDAATRASLLSDFARGDIPALIAMRALDEGVDVPETREAHLLASSGNPREFIQRRGRVLRLSPGKTHAIIVDYVVVPGGDGAYTYEITRREVQRVLEFAGAAANADAARHKIWPMLQQFDLVHLAGEHL